MLINIIIFVIILITLVLILRYSKECKEEFFNFPDSDHNSYVTDSQTKFNPLTNTVNLINPAIPITPDNSNTFKKALSVVIANPTPTGYKLETKSDFNLPDSSPNTFQITQSCESRTNDCSAFDDPVFAANCGISFDTKAETASGKIKMGGLFISTEDRQQQTARAAAVLETGSAPYDPYKVYRPTLGKSKPGTFALNKDQCVIVKEKVECATKQTFGSPNCSQCYTSQTFSRVDPTTGRLPFNILFVGNGMITVTPTNTGSCHAWTPDEEAKFRTDSSIATQQSVCNATPGQAFQGANGPISKCGGCWCCEGIPFFLNNTTLDKANPITMAVTGNSEGVTFNISVVTSDGSMPWLAGYISGQTPRGEFKVDLITLADKDNSTNKRPKLNGTATINGFRSMVLIPGGGTSGQLSLSGMIPFTFLSVYDGDALNCDNGPIITQAASATFLESDPCFSKSNKPGSYSLECLQSRWLELGGTQQGTGYPSNQTSAAAIQTGANGSGLDIDTIVNSLAPKMASALSGVDTNGTQLSISDWNSLSMWATGTPISSPCDGPNKDTGPLSQECLSYLYLNKGAASRIGATYTLLPSQVASMTATNSETYCQPGAPLDPNTSEGLKKGQSLGGVTTVKSYYDQINRLANDNTQTNSARSDAINQCYGVNLDPTVVNTPPGPTQVFMVGPDYMYSRSQAADVCSKYGAQVATTSQLNDAQKNGADWCFTGWVSDSNTAQYPINTSIKERCASSPGVVSWSPSSQLSGVNCYGPKPAIDSYPNGVIFPFNSTNWNQSSTTK